MLTISDSPRPTRGVIRITDARRRTCQPVAVRMRVRMRRRLAAATAACSLMVGMVVVGNPAFAVAQPAKLAPRRQVNSTPGSHSCCPHRHRLPLPAISMGLPPAGMPCQDRPCCRSQTPDTRSGMPAASGIRRPAARPLPIQAAVPSGRLSSTHVAVNTLQNCSSFSTVLRI